MKRFLSCCLLILFLASTGFASIKSNQIQVEPSIIFESVKPADKQLKKTFQIKLNVEKWVMEIYPKDKKVIIEKPTLEFQFPQVVIDDVIVYLEDTPKERTLMPFNNSTHWNPAFTQSSAKNPG